MKRFTLLFRSRARLPAAAPATATDMKPLPRPVVRRLAACPQVVADALLPPELRILQQLYAHFCESRVMSYEQAERDFISVCRSPGVRMLAFADHGDELLIATEHVTLRDRDIGEFVIRIRRKPQTSILFENMTPLIVRQALRDGAVQLQLYHHPHISSGKTICMNDGLLELRTSISEGDLPTAVAILWQALTTIGDMPYSDARLDHWPKHQEKHDARHETA